MTTTLIIAILLSPLAVLWWAAARYEQNRRSDAPRPVLPLPRSTWNGYRWETVSNEDELKRAWRSRALARWRMHQRMRKLVEGEQHHA